MNGWIATDDGLVTPAGDLMPRTSWIPIRLASNALGAVPAHVGYLIRAERYGRKVGLPPERWYNVCGRIFVEVDWLIRALQRQEERNLNTPAKRANKARMIRKMLERTGRILPGEVYTDEELLYGKWPGLKDLENCARKRKKRSGAGDESVGQ